MIILDYILIAFVFTGVFVIGWICILMMANLFLTNQFDYFYNKSEAAMEAREFDSATRYNERLQTITQRINKVENLLYFQFFA